MSVIREPLHKANLFINTRSIQSMIHDVHPAIFGGEHKEGHQRLAQVVKVVLLVYPTVFRVAHTVPSVTGNG